MVEYETRTGWWSFSFEGVPELFDSDLEHIANLIKDGCTGGQIIQEIGVEE